MNATRAQEPAAAVDPQRHPERFLPIDRLTLRKYGLLPPPRQERRLANEYRVIKRPLLGNASGRASEPIERGNLLMVASALSGEGKTFTCVNLALSLALERDWSVLLVDGDVIEASLSRVFGLESRPGLVDLLLDPGRALSDHILATDVEGLSLLPAGRRDDQAAELLSSARMEELAAGLSRGDPRRMAVFDSPPLLMTPEAPALAGHMGQILLVVQAGRTSQQRVQQALARVDSGQAVNLVLNQADLGDESLAYGAYGYGSENRDAR